MRKFLGVILSGMLCFSSAFAADDSTSNLHSLYMPAGNAIAGNPKGSITMVEFFDYNCGYCRMMYPKLLDLIQSNHDLRVIFREYPVLSPRSILPAKAALAAQRQGKYQQLHNAMMEAKTPLDESGIVRIGKSVGLDTNRLLQDMKDPAIEKQLADTMALGQTMNIQGVPTFIVVRTSPPAKSQPQVVVGPSVGRLEAMIKDAKGAV
jgi:protein-disulfide isomerase